MRLIFVLGCILFAFNINTATAGRLGTCWECFTENGASFHRWDKNNALGGQCGLLDGNSKKGNPTICDANEGVHRYGPTNDPFWKCDAGGGEHDVWVGGENLDLIVLGEKGSPVSSGAFFRIQDGEEYVCGRDVVSGRNFTALRYGDNWDLIDIFIHNGTNSFQRNTDRIHDGRGHGMVVGQNYVARLYGNHKDILKLYGIKTDGTIVSKARLINNGRHHIMQRLSDTDVGLTYGRNKDINVRFCFDGNRWMTGYIGIGHGFKASCDTVLNW